MGLFIEFLKILIWPAVVIFGLIKFYKPISKFLKRMTTVNAMGINITADQPTNSENRTITSIEESEYKTNPTVQNVFEDVIEKELDARDMDKSSKTSKFLISLLAATEIRFYFERIDKFIYGSQVAILYRLNSLNDGEDKGNLKSHYDAAAKIWPNIYSQYSYEKYFDYLLSTNFIVENDGNVKITELGREFLSYAARSGYTGVRQF